MSDVLFELDLGSSISTSRPMATTSSFHWKPLSTSVSDDLFALCALDDAAVSFNLMTEESVDLETGDSVVLATLLALLVGTICMESTREKWLLESRRAPLLPSESARGSDDRIFVESPTFEGVSLRLLNASMRSGRTAQRSGRTWIPVGALPADEASLFTVSADRLLLLLLLLLLPPLFLLLPLLLRLRLEFELGFEWLPSDCRCRLLVELVLELVKVEAAVEAEVEMGIDGDAEEVVLDEEEKVEVVAVVILMVVLEAAMLDSPLLQAPWCPTGFSESSTLLE